MNLKTIQSGIYGLIIGDALGVPVEFYTRNELLKDPVTDMREYGTWQQPRGTWSDDSSMTLATIDSINNNHGEINLNHMMKNYVRWMLNGDYTQSGDIPFDVGTTTSQAISNYINTGNINTCGLSGEYNNGNGSLMRILPLAFLDCTYDVVEKVSGLTHNHIRSKIACNLYVEIAKQILNGGEDTFCDYVSKASENIINHYRNEPELDYFHRIFNRDYEDGVTGKIHVVDTLETAIYSIRVAEDYKSSLLTAVNIGNDTDTVCAVCGGLAGLYYGYDDIPTEWLNNIWNKNIVDDLLDKFYDVI